MTGNRQHRFRKAEVSVLLANSSPAKNIFALHYVLQVRCRPKKPVVLETEGLGPKLFHVKVIRLANRDIASAAELIVALARENKLATIIGEKTASRLLSARSVWPAPNFRIQIILS